MDGLIEITLNSRRLPSVEWGMATRALPGECESGDRPVVQPFPGGVLVGVVDGLGHGEEAAAAARITTAILARCAREAPASLVRRCHEALTDTRGVVMSIAAFSARASAMTWLGVGNVEGVLVRTNDGAAPARERLLLRGGVVGYQLPELRASVVSVARGDTLVFATDGIRGDFTDHLTPGERPQPLADRVLAQFGGSRDDALVLVAQFLGEVHCSSAP